MESAHTMGSAFPPLLHELHIFMAKRIINKQKEEKDTQNTIPQKKASYTRLYLSIDNGARCPI